MLVSGMHHSDSIIFNYIPFQIIFPYCCCSVAQSCLTLCDPMACSMGSSLSITNSQSLLKLTSIELVMPSNYLISAIPFSSFLQPFPASDSFQMSWLFTWGGQRIEASVSASVHVLAIVNSAAMNVGVHVSFSVMVFSGYMPSNGIVVSYVSFILSFYKDQGLPWKLRW